jgi:hypothetical protein
VLGRVLMLLMLLSQLKIPSPYRRIKNDHHPKNANPEELRVLFELKNCILKREGPVLAGFFKRLNLNDEKLSIKCVNIS